MGLTKYWEVGKVSLYNSLAYRMDFFAFSLFIGLIIFIFINLWSTIYADGTKLIEGFSIGMMIWYLVLTESIVTSPGRVIEDIGNEIQSGNVAQNLNKPYNYVLFHYASSMAKSLFRFVLTFSIGGVVALTFIGGLKVSLWSIPLIIISIALALTLHFCMMALISVYIIWLEDAKAINFIYNKFVFVLGGMLLPLEIFPTWLAKISQSLPFSYVAYYPAKLGVMFNWDLFLKVIFGQLAWTLLVIILIIISYKFCFKRISINGG
jgi:ABC-2 type transport system permease protein